MKYLLLILLFVLFLISCDNNSPVNTNSVDTVIFVTVSKDTTLLGSFNPFQEDSLTNGFDVERGNGIWIIQYQDISIDHDFLPSIFVYCKTSNDMVWNNIPFVIRSEEYTGEIVDYLYLEILDEDPVKYSNLFKIVIRY